MTAYPTPIDPSPTHLPLYVDLDGTLIRGDTTQQASLALLRQNPLALLKAAAVYGQGRAASKKVIGDHVALDAASLPYRPEVIDYVKQAKAQGRRVVLATGAERRIADAVARHLGLFDAVLATDNGLNLTSTRKLAAMVADGGEHFEYLGDSHADGKIFDASAVSGWVGVKNICRTDANTRGLHRMCSEPVNRPKDVLRLMRPHQWTKNLLVLLPAADEPQTAQHDCRLAHGRGDGGPVADRVGLLRPERRPGHRHRPAPPRQAPPAAGARRRDPCFRGRADGGVDDRRLPAPRASSANRRWPPSPLTLSSISLTRSISSDACSWTC